MGKIYIGQTALKITVEVKSDLTDASNQVIKYIKPNGTTGQFTALVDNPSFGVISHTISNATEIDQSGEWTFWAFITYSGGQTIAGEPSCVTIHVEGT